MTTRHCRTPNCPHLAVGVMYVQSTLGADTATGVPMCLSCIHSLTTFLLAREQEGAETTVEVRHTDP